MREGDLFSRRIRISNPLGSISAVRAGNHQQMVLGAYGLRERGGLTGWGLWSSICARVTCLAGESEYRAPWARYRWDVRGMARERWWGPMGCGREVG